MCAGQVFFFFFFKHFEKEKLLIMSNFSFYLSVFYPFGEFSAIFIKFKMFICKLFKLGRDGSLPFGQELTHYHTILHFDALKMYSCENIVRKGEIACNKQFLLFSQCFLPYMVLIFHFKCTVKCRLQFVSIWTNLKLCHLVMG